LVIDFSMKNVHLGDSGAADASASAAEFFKRQPALFYRGRQSKAPRRVEQLQSDANLIHFAQNPLVGALVAGLGVASGLTGACLGLCSAYEIERRAGGARSHRRHPAHAIPTAGINDP
jgi:hypothetical protein